MIQIADLSVPLDYDLNMLENGAAERLKIDLSLISVVRILKKSVDASNKEDIHFKITVGADVYGDELQTVWQCHDKGVSRLMEPAYRIPGGRGMARQEADSRPVVVGFGPAGLFAALILAQAGERPIVLERGLDVDNRKNSIQTFWGTGKLDVNSNVQFGEGGAGAFSDGKLKVGCKDARKTKVIDELIQAGAPEEIAYLEKPHIGTDRLPGIVKRIREEIVRLGGEVRFHSTVTEILHKDGKVTGIRYIEINDSNNSNLLPPAGKETEMEMETGHVVLAIGHSARDTYRRMFDCGVRMEQKSIAVGVRIEHPQHRINEIRYGPFAGHKALGAADYRMVVHLPNQRGVYTFCMCPGGTVIAASSDAGCLVTNGMSEYERSGQNANTALLVTVDKNEFGSDHPLAGIEFQRRIEEKAFAAGGGGYRAPIQRLEDFIKKRNTRTFGEVFPTYLPGTAFAEVDSYLPDDLPDSMRQAITGMEEWMPGFAYPDALLTGAETRSSSAVCISRGEDLQAVGLKGLYPCGEGAGYAGGIISAAVDGIRCAEKIIG